MACMRKRTLTVYSSVVSKTASPLVTCSRPEASTAKCTLSFGASLYFALAASMPADSVHSSHHLIRLDSFSYGHLAVIKRNQVDLFQA